MILFLYKVLFTDNSVEHVHINVLAKLAMESCIFFLSDLIESHKEGVLIWNINNLDWLVILCCLDYRHHWVVALLCRLSPRV